MTVTTPSYGAIGRPFPGRSEVARTQPERLSPAWRIAIAARRAETAHALASALQTGAHDHTVELLQFPAPQIDGFAVAAPDLLLIEHPSETSLKRLLREVPHMRVVVFGEDRHDDSDSLARLVRAGAHGYLDPAAEPGEIRLAVEQVMAGKAWMEHRVVSRCVCAPESAEDQMAVKLRGNIDSMCEQLTRREKEILCQVIRGYAIKQIAAEVHLSHQGVKMHLARLFRKFGAANRNQLILAVLDRISPVKDLSASLCSGLRNNLMETAD